MYTADRLSQIFKSLDQDHILFSYVLNVVSHRPSFLHLDALQHSAIYQGFQRYRICWPRNGGCHIIKWWTHVSCVYSLTLLWLKLERSRESLSFLRRIGTSAEASGFGPSNNVSSLTLSEPTLKRFSTHILQGPWP